MIDLDKNEGLGLVTIFAFVFVFVFVFVLQSRNLFSHRIQGDTVGTADVALTGIVFPRTEDEHTAIGDSIEDVAGWLVIVAEAVVSQDDEGMLLSEKHGLHFFLLGGDKGRDHHRALSGRQHTAVHIVAQGLWATLRRFVN